MRLTGLFLSLLVGLTLPELRADRAADIARIHIEAIGGRTRINLMTTLAATGRVEIDGREMRFRLLAERPNRLRMETEFDGRRLVQGTDGENPPWQFNPDDQPVVVTRLSGQQARDFAADAEFDDPLVDYAERGYVLDYAGEATVDGRKVLKLLVTRRLVDSYFLLVDAETYFITRRVTPQVRGGLEVVRETIYDDFRPVGGVIMPHRITVRVGDRQLHDTIMLTVTSNARVPTGSFSPPVAGEK
jgi:outer membrane lipoprotein-sorting protein